MGKFRKIIVDNSEYMWLFRYDGYDYQKFPYLLITTKAFPKATIESNLFNEATWNEDLSENIFDYIKKSPAFAYAKNKGYIKTEIYMDET